MTKQRKTSKKAAKSASKVLRDKRTGKDSKAAAGSALSQRAPKKRSKQELITVHEQLNQFVF